MTEAGFSIQIKGSAMTEKYALVIGIDEYQSPSLKKLTTPAKNAELLARKLELDNNFHVTRFPKIWIKDEAAPISKQFGKGGNNINEVYQILSKHILK